MATSKRPTLRKHDRVTISPIMRVIPPYDGKPWVLRDTVLTVSNLTGTGSKRSPWAVVVTDGTHFWSLEPGDVARVEETAPGSSHSTVSRDLNAWLDRHGYGGRSHAKLKGSAHTPIQVAHRGYLIRQRSDKGFSITKDGHVIQHQTPTVESAKAIIDQLID